MDGVKFDMYTLVVSWFNAKHSHGSYCIKFNLHSTDNLISLYTEKSMPITLKCKSNASAGKGIRFLRIRTKEYISH